MIVSINDVSINVTIYNITVPSLEKTARIVVIVNKDTVLVLIWCTDCISILIYCEITKQIICWVVFCCADKYGRWLHDATTTLHIKHKLCVIVQTVPFWK